MFQPSEVVQDSIPKSYPHGIPNYITILSQKTTITTQKMPSSSTITMDNT